MKILLIEPAKAPVTLGGEDVSLFEPLALGYLAAGVRKDHDVRILDQRRPQVDWLFDRQVVGKFRLGFVRWRSFVGRWFFVGRVGLDLGG